MEPHIGQFFTSTRAAPLLKISSRLRDPRTLRPGSRSDRPRPELRSNSLRQASPSRATKQLMPTPRGRRPPPTPGGGSGLSYYVFRGAMPGRCLAYGGVRLRRQGTGREGRGKGGKEGEEKRREEVEWRWLWWVAGKGRREGGEGMLVGSGGASTSVQATTSTVSPPMR